MFPELGLPPGSEPGWGGGTAVPPAPREPHVPPALPGALHRAGGAQRSGLVLSTMYPLGHQCLPQTAPGCTRRRRVAARLDIEVKYGAALNYSVGERGSQDGVLRFCSVINSL